MLVYHPMFDPYHSALRIVCILKDCRETKLEWDKVRLLDFFVTFPHLLKAIKLPQALRSGRAALKSVPIPYENFANPPKILFQMNAIQAAAVSLLVASDLVAAAEFREGYVVLNEEFTDSALAKPLGNAKFREQGWYQFLTKQLCGLPLNGKDGLKERSGLMEFRHDPA